jgi:SAM-dependent methyltransferase
MDVLSKDEYVRERRAPRPGDLFYLCLSDLLIVLRALIPKHPMKVLDYGCGGSPYRDLFDPGCVYERADLDGQNLDFTYGPDSMLPAEAKDYDFILSSQVLEHVETPATYLGECYRVLKPGGQVLITTHGTFEDHACPQDYWRWTAHGLSRIVVEAGLEVAAVKKMTTGPRATLSMGEREFNRLRFPKDGLYGRALSTGIRAVQRIGTRRLHMAADKSLGRYRVANVDECGHDIYVGVAVLASRPPQQHRA